MTSPWRDLARPPLRLAALRQALVVPGSLWTALDVVAETGSTNADLVSRAASTPHGGVLLADHQSSGRGRLGRTWQAPPRASLAVSVLLRPSAPVQRWSWLPLMVGVAMAEAVTRTCGVRARLKWPNDVLLVAGPRPGKVAGVLAEVADDAVVLGVGLNTGLTQGELGEMGEPGVGATSLSLAGAATTDRDVLARAYLRSLADRWTSWEAAGGDAVASGLAAAYREECDTVGREVQVWLPSGDVLTGLADGVDDVGRLLLRPADGGGEVALAAGDVVHLRPAPSPEVVW